MKARTKMKISHKREGRGVAGKNRKYGKKATKKIVDRLNGPKIPVAFAQLELLPEPSPQSSLKQKDKKKIRIPLRPKPKAKPKSEIGLFSKNRKRPRPFSNAKTANKRDFPASSKLSAQQPRAKVTTEDNYTVESRKGPSLTSNSPRDVSNALSTINTKLPDSTPMADALVIKCESTSNNPEIEEEKKPESKTDTVIEEKIKNSLVGNVAERDEIQDDSSECINEGDGIFGLTEAAVGTSSGISELQATKEIKDKEKDMLDKFFELPLTEQIRLLDSHDACNTPLYSSSGRVQNLQTDRKKKTNCPEKDEAEDVVPLIEDLGRVKGEIGQLPQVLHSEIDVLKCISLRENSVMNMAAIYGKMFDILLETKKDQHTTAKKAKLRLQKISEMQRDMRSLVLKLRDETIDAVNSINKWREVILDEERKRQSTSKNYSFIYHGTNYLLKMEQDLEFLDGEHIRSKYKNKQEDEFGLSSADNSGDSMFFAGMDYQLEKKKLKNLKEVECAELISRWIGFSAKGNPLLLPPEGLDVKKSIMQHKQKMETRLAEQKKEKIRRRITVGLSNGLTAKEIFSPIDQHQHRLVKQGSSPVRSKNQNGQDEKNKIPPLNLLGVHTNEMNNGKSEKEGLHERLNLNLLRVSSARHHEGSSPSLLQRSSISGSSRNLLGSNNAITRQNSSPRRTQLMNSTDMLSARGYDEMERKGSSVDLHESSNPYSLRRKSSRPRVAQVKIESKQNRSKRSLVATSEYTPEEQIVTALSSEKHLVAQAAEKHIKEEKLLLERVRKEALIALKNQKHEYDPVLELSKRGGIPYIMTTLEEKIYSNEEDMYKTIKSLARRQQEGLVEQSDDQDEETAGVLGKPLGKPGEFAEALRKQISLKVEKDFLQANMEEKEIRRKVISSNDADLVDFGKKKPFYTLGIKMGTSNDDTVLNNFSGAESQMWNQRRKRHMGILSLEESNALNSEAPKAGESEEDINAVVEYDAAVMIQAFVRATFTRAAVLQLIEDEKMLTKFNEFNEMEASATLIQAHVRRLLVQKEMQLREAEVLMEKQRKEQKELEERNEKDRYEDLKARGRRRREEMEREKKQRLEDIAKSFADKNHQAKRLTMGIRQLLRRKKKNTSAQASEDHYKVDFRSMAAMKIQAMIRGVLAKSKYGRDKDRESIRVEMEDKRRQERSEYSNLYQNFEFKLEDDEDNENEVNHETADSIRKSRSESFKVQHHDDSWDNSSGEGFSDLVFPMIGRHKSARKDVPDDAKNKADKKSKLSTTTLPQL